MKRIRDLKKLVKEENKVTATVYFILRFLVILCMIREFMNGNIQNALLCILSLILFLLPSLIERRFKIELPTTFEVIIFLFIFASEILGEINNFYGAIPYWDTILHTLNGFLSASVGFSLIYLLNENIETFKLSPIFVSLMAFCFSMTIGITWEFFEYGMDNIFNLDMQKDEYVEEIKTVTLDPTNSNQVIKISDINEVILYNENNQQLIKLNGYLDIGLHDTMKDLIVNFIGAFIFSYFGYLYIINKDKYKIASRFIATKKA